MAYAKDQISLLTFSELTIHLPPKNMEQIRWGGHVAYLHVAILMLTVKLLWGREDPWVLVTELKISLHSSR